MKRSSFINCIRMCVCVCVSCVPDVSVNCTQQFKSMRSEDRRRQLVLETEGVTEVHAYSGDEKEDREKSLLNRLICILFIINYLFIYEVPNELTACQTRLQWYVIKINFIYVFYFHTTKPAIKNDWSFDFLRSYVKIHCFSACFCAAYTANNAIYAFKFR